MIIKSEKMGYDKQKKQYVPLYQLDTENAVVAVFDENARKYFTDKVFGTVTNIIAFHTDYAQKHINYVMKNSPERLQRKVNEGAIIDYLSSIENRAFEAVENQVDKWKESDKEYQLAVIEGDLLKAAGLENNLIARAKELIYPTIIYA